MTRSIQRLAVRRMGEEAVAHRCLETFFLEGGSAGGRGLNGAGVKWTEQWTEIFAKLSESPWNVCELPRVGLSRFKNRSGMTRRDAHASQRGGIDLSPLVSARRCAQVSAGCTHEGQRRLRRWDSFRLLSLFCGDLTANKRRRAQRCDARGPLTQLNHEHRSD